MNLEGVAALLALPAGLLAAVTPWALERTWSAHLDRVVKLQQSGIPLGELESRMLESVRKRLVEKLAVATLVPRRLEFLVLGVMGIVGGVAWLVVSFIDASAADARGVGDPAQILEQGVLDTLMLVLTGSLCLLFRVGLRNRRIIELQRTGDVRREEIQDFLQPRDTPLWRRRKQPPQPAEERDPEA
ncbi:hypothetical protein [Curtobacterium sp. MCPF17_046]|uniref:hypothetical protein n=1 Tax=Curtobacterium sp. MCPF17_046 TaxID=2175663 RepID=UPI000D9203EC|nr:hypothetical protein [Curtobacterium sp. MCPF17_046]PYY34463.1 hypothetical protein DEJ32_14735 [Curtobacterium sp. MCPF17_046]